GIVHGDLARGLLFDSGSEPALTEVVPYARPASWSAAVVAVDHLSWGTVDPGVLGRWAHLDDWPQMVLRAAVFRLAVHALHPGSRPAAMEDRKSTRLNSSHVSISYAVFCLKKKKEQY